jgi:hypothetical protein
MKRFICLMMVCAGMSAAQIAGAQEFSAGIVSTTNGVSVNGTVLVSKDKIRMEMAPAVTIARLDKNVAWVLMSDQKMYMEMPMEAQNLAMSMEKVPGEISRTLIGTESIGGRDTEKYEVTYQVQGRTETVFVWLSKTLHFPLKSSARDGSWIVEYSNVTEGAQPQEMFEIPAGYTKFEYGATPSEAAGY